MNIKWDAQGYTSGFQFVHEYGNDVISLLELREGQRVIDLGCGNGALTKKLAELGATAVGIDSSPELLDVARRSYPQLEFMQADATEFTVVGKVDAVFSNAVFHWIERDKHKDLLRCVAAAIKKSGIFAFEFGGSGNNAQIHAAMHRAFSCRGLQYKMPFYFPTIGEYAPMLEMAGFRVVFATLFERPTELKGSDGLADWIAMFLRTPFQGIDERVKAEIVRETVEELKPSLFHGDRWYADYVRIRMKAIRTE